MANLKRIALLEVLRRNLVFENNRDRSIRQKVLALYLGAVATSAAKLHRSNQDFLLVPAPVHQRMARLYYQSFLSNPLHDIVHQSQATPAQNSNHQHHLQLL